MKTKRKFTPGPWEANGTSVVASSHTFICLFDCKPLRMTLSGEECAANALLIAAAPDMLDTLESILASLAYSDGSPIYPCHKDRINMIKHVIQKAIGESPCP